MKKFLIAVTAIAAMTASAQAATLDYTFSFTGIDGTLPGPVTGLIELPSNCTTCKATAVIIDSWPNAFDREGTLPFVLNPYLSVDSFVVSGGQLTSINYKSRVNGGPDGLYVDLFTSPVDANLYDPTTTAQVYSTTLDIAPLTATPLPAAAPLFAAGLGGLGLLGWRKKRKNAVLTAA